MIVGRAAELARCDDVLDAVSAGRCARLLVLGDPGIGKSALLDVVRRRAARRALHVVRVCGVEGEDDLPFGLVDSLMAALGAPADSSSRASRRSSALLDALAAVTASAPVLLVVDDLQSADGPSVTALSVALHQGDDLPLGALVAGRSDAGIERRCSAWPRMDLLPLATSAAEAVLRSRIGPDADPVALRALAAALGGNPLALLEAPHLLSADQLSGRAPLPDPLPLGPALKRAWGSRLDRLSPQARLALLDLAVSGSQPLVLAALAPVDGGALLDPAVAEGLVCADPGSGPVFAHPLLREVVLARAPRARLRERHRLAALGAARAELAPAVVVHHLVRSCAGPDATVAALIAEQAERAERIERPHEAVAAWEAAARLSPGVAERVARAQRGIRRLAAYRMASEYTAPLVDLVQGQLLDPESACLVQFLRSELRAAVDPDAGLATLWSAVAHARASVPRLLPGMLYEAATYAWQLGDATTALRAVREFAAIDARPETDRGDLPPWTATALLATGLFQTGDVVASVPLRREAIAAAALVDPDELGLDALLEIVMLDDLLLDLSPQAGHRLLVAADRVGREGEPLACLWGIQGWRARARGDWDAARALLAQGRPLAELTGARWPEIGMTALAVDLAASSSDDDVLSTEVERLRRLATTVRDDRRLSTLDRAVGLRALLDGRLDAAVASLTAAADRRFLGRGLRDGVVPARADLVEALVRTGETAAARDRYARLQPLLRAMDEPLATALGLRSQALIVDDPQETERLLAQALAAHGLAEDPFERSRTLLILGETRRRCRCRSGARVALEEAVEAFARLGAQPWQRRAAQELHACGGGAPAPGAATRGPIADLTRQELAVARAVARGCSNREVAASLFLSPRTVDFHLANAYRKLGVRGRGGLAGRLAAIGREEPASS